MSETKEAKIMRPLARDNPHFSATRAQKGVGSMGTIPKWVQNHNPRLERALTLVLFLIIILSIDRAQRAQLYDVRKLEA